MENVKFLLIVTLIYMISSAFLASWLADKKGYKERIWFWVGFFLGIMAILTLGLAPNKETEEIILLRTLVENNNNSIIQNHSVNIKV